MAPSGLWKVLNATQSNDQVDAVDLHARRRLRKLLECDVAQGNIHERAGIEIVEVVMRVGVRVEPAAVTSDGELANEARGREQIQRVVDGRLGDPQAEAAQTRQDLVSGQVLGTAEQQRCNAQPLRGGPDAVAHET